MLRRQSRSADLTAENQLLCQQPVVACRQITRLELRPQDRTARVLLARRTQTWASTMFLVQPETLLPFRREGVKLLRKRKPRTRRRGSRVTRETIALIHQTAQNNHLRPLHPSCNNV